MDLNNIMSKVKLNTDRPFQELTSEEINYLFKLWARRKGITYRLAALAKESLIRSFEMK